MPSASLKNGASFYKKDGDNKMSYCVNCGVELDGSAKKCPLCDTPVINPNLFGESENANPPFPSKIELPKKVRSRYAAFIASFIILLPNIICVITNILLTPKMHWSIYVVATSALIYFLAVFPFLISKKYAYLTLVLDAIVTNLYIFIFYYEQSETTGWFFPLAMPITCAFFLTVGFLYSYFRKKKTILKSIIAILTAILAMDIFICLTVNLYAKSVIITYITMIIAVSSAITLIFFIVANNNIRLRAWLSRKFFF